ncbi:MAG TPA: formyltetrahydrofolate deformylase [Streptosporangiaceae bacterium]|jgi:formyltetrahydrofolate deformylase
MTEPAAHPGYILTLSCADVPGIVFAVSRFLAGQNCNITQSQQFGDPQTGTFFMRVSFTPAGATGLAPGPLRKEFAPVAEEFGMTWRLLDAADRQRVLIMVSRFGHCLNDLLFRWSIGALPIDVAAVVSNHPDFARLAGGYGVPFRHIPVTPETKPAAETALRALIAGHGVDLVVLARYMQILSAGLCTELAGRVINIHHSMLPSFKGARPYQQAHTRGVKLIGATAHYVTPGLDEGPIIEQEVARIDHSMTADEVAAIGRDLECQALARAVRWHAESRVLLNGHRTIVFH